MSWRSEHINTNFVFAEADERVLKTMNRSNPGLILLKNGEVVNKWDDGDVPDFSIHSIDRWDERSNVQRNFWIKLMVILSLFIIPLAIVKVYDVKQNREK